MAAVAAGAEGAPVRGSTLSPASTALRSAPLPSATNSRCALCAETQIASALKGDAFLVSLQQDDRAWRRCRAALLRHTGMTRSKGEDRCEASIPA